MVQGWLLGRPRGSQGLPERSPPAFWLLGLGMCRGVWRWGRVSERGVCTSHSSQASRSPLLTLRLCLCCGWGSPQHPWRAEPPSLPESQPHPWGWAPGWGQRGQCGEATQGRLRGPGYQFMMARGGHCGREGKDAGPDRGLTQPELWNQRGTSAAGIDCSRSDRVHGPASVSGCGQPREAMTLGQDGLHL